MRDIRTIFNRPDPTPDIRTIFNRPDPAPVGVAAERGEVWNVGTGDLGAFLRAVNLHCSSRSPTWLGNRLCAGRAGTLSYLDDHTVRVECDRCGRIVARVEFQTEGSRDDLSSYFLAHSRPRP